MQRPMGMCNCPKRNSLRRRSPLPFSASLLPLPSSDFSPFFPLRSPPLPSSYSSSLFLFLLLISYTLLSSSSPYILIPRLPNHNENGFQCDYSCYVGILCSQLGSVWLRLKTQNTRTLYNWRSRPVSWKISLENKYKKCVF